MAHPLEGAFLTAELPDEPICIICRFREDALVPQSPAVHFQVTVSKDKLSGSGKYIRFDARQGDEVHGWMRRELIMCEEVLGQVKQKEGTLGEVVPLAA